MSIKQIKIDNGTIGGIIASFTGGLFIVNIVTLALVFGNAYDSYLHRYVSSLYVAFVICVVLAMAWFTFYYIVIYPSSMTFLNEQAYKHDSPIKKDFEYIKNRLDEIEKEIKNNYQ